MICHACGRQNAPQSRFCQYCGVAVSTTTPSGSPPKPQGTVPVAATPEVQTTAETAEPAASPGPNAPLPAGTRLRDRYVIQKQLGQGGFGRTYLAQDTGRFDTPIVLKELTPSVHGTSELYKAEELFKREAETLHRLEHPQIPRFWETFQAQKRLFLVEDYVAGQTYQQLLIARQPQGQLFNEMEIVQLFRDLLPVLAYLHGEGIIHRDISPDNIMRRDKDGVPILIDLGGVKQMALEIATQVVPQPTSSGSAGATRLGKVGYAPDEQMRLGIVAPHSDLYALAVTALVLMTCKPPQALQDSYSLEWLWQRELTLSPQFTQVLNRMLAARPMDRFQAATDVLQALNQTAEPPPTQVGSSVPPTQVTASESPPATLVTPPQTLGVTNTSGQGTNSIVPEPVRGWNWGAFLLPGCWCLTNRVWIGLLAWPGLLLCGLGWLVMGIVLGSSGNEWAWRQRSWRSVDDFKAHQRGWTIGGLITMGAVILMVMAAAVSELGEEVAYEDEPTDEQTSSAAPSVEPRTSPQPSSTTSPAFEFRAIRISGLETYTHGPPVFSLLVPQGWTLEDNSEPGELILVWDDPTGNGRLIVDIFDTTGNPTQAELTKQLQNFLQDQYGKRPKFYLEDPQPQDDGSVRVIWGFTGTATGDIKVPFLGNSFIERRGDRVAVLTFIVPNAQFKDLQGSLNKIINNYDIDPTVSLPQ